MHLSSNSRPFSTTLHNNSEHLYLLPTTPALHLRIFIISDKTKVVNGVVVTNTDVPLSRDWTNVYDDIGGDLQWNEDMEEMVKGRGLDGDVQPFFGTCSYTGEATFLMQIGGRDFIFWKCLDDSMYHVNGNLTLQKILDDLDEEGLNAFDLEEI